MNIAPLGGVLSSAAGAPLAQSKGTDVERAQHDTAAQQRETKAAQQAENAAGIAATDGEDHETNERDADGRRLWEENPAAVKTKPPAGTGPAPDVGASRDASGQLGHQLDLSG